MTAATENTRSPARSERDDGWRAIGWLTVFLMAAAVNPVSAQLTNLVSISQQTNGFVVQVPSNKAVSRRSGLQLEVDTRWVNNYGYRPIRVQVNSPKPTKAEHRITIRLYVASSDWRSGSVGVEQDFEMPLGATSAETVVACPQFQAGHRYWWDVRVDGVLDKDLSVADSASWQLTATANNTNSDNTALKFLVVGPPGQLHQVIGPGSDMFEALVLSIADFPARWIDYSAVDVVAVSPNDLQTLAKAAPDKLQALRRWTRAGGQLWVSPVGGYWEQLDKVERLLELSTPSNGAAESNQNQDTGRETNVEITARGWKPIKLDSGSKSGRRVTFQYLPTGRTRVVREPANIARLKSDPDWVVLDDDTTAPAADNDVERLKRDSTEWYVQRPMGLGAVRVFREAWDPTGFAISWQSLRGISDFDSFVTSQMTTPLTAAMATTHGWEARHGMTPDTANADFANLLVPGVGQAPVSEFRVLITLFVLVIGPLNYWLLKRTNRLHLLVLTVPLMAAAATTGLFAYALVSDGLATKVRVRSFTTLDQHSGEAACWARLSFYAGLAPGRGLTLPDDVALYPIIPGWNETSNGAFLGAARQMEWTDGRQRLTEGWLRSRTPTQFLSVRARKSPHRLDVRQAFQPDTAPSSQAGKPDVQVTNELGTRIEFVAVVDDAGRIFGGEAIADRATAELSPSSRLEALRQLRKLVIENEPATPPALADEETSFAITQRRRQRRFFRTQLGLEYGMERLGENLQSDAIAALVGSGGEPVFELPPRLVRGDDGNRAGSRDRRRRCRGGSEFSCGGWKLVISRSMIRTASPQIELRRLHRVFDRHARRERRVVRGARGRGVRLHRPERGRQDDQHADPGDARRADRRRRVGRRLLGGRRSRPRAPPAGLHARLFRHVSERQRPRVSRLLRPRVRAASGAERLGAIGEVMEFTQLDTLADKPIDGLSKGMKQRLCLGRTMIHDPSVLVLDEPAAGLDPRARIELREMIARLADAGKAILISSHILTELAEICDRVGIIEQGRLLAVGSVAEISARAQGREHGSRDACSTMRERLQAVAGRARRRRASCGCDGDAGDRSAMSGDRRVGGGAAAGDRRGRLRGRRIRRAAQEPGRRLPARDGGPRAMSDGSSDQRSTRQPPRQTTAARPTSTCGRAGRRGLGADRTRASSALGDWFNPILVKETRQALKSLQFTITFVLVLVACWVVTIGGVAVIGPSIFYAAAGGTMLTVVLRDPGVSAGRSSCRIAAFRSLAAEREDNTYDLLSITTLKPRQIISGKLGSSIVQMVVYLLRDYALPGVHLPAARRRCADDCAAAGVHVSSRRSGCR